MHRYVIERGIPEIGKASAADLRDASQRANDVVKELSPDIQWVESYVTDNKLFCVFFGANEEVIRKHAAAAGFPADTITEVRTVMDPTTATA